MAGFVLTEAADNSAMGSELRGISSMATRQVLAELSARWARQGGGRVDIESVGGVDAARRVRAGEAFDLVFLASDAIDALIEGGQLRAGSRVDLMRSGVAVAVRSGSPPPSLRDAEAVRAAVLAAPRIGYSTGPSGTALLALFERWGIRAALSNRLVQARPGVPVASLVAQGEVDLGFQQRSELLGVSGIDIVGDLPADIQITTVFSAGVGASSAQAERAAELLAFLASDAAAEPKRQHGMAPA